MLNVIVFVIEFFLSFLSLCPVLVYHEYTSAIIGTWRVGARLQVYPTTNTYTNTKKIKIRFD